MGGLLIIWLRFPKLRLVTGVGIGEFIENLPRLEKHLSNPKFVEDQNFWRLSPSLNYAWTFPIRYVNGEDVALSMDIEGPDENTEQFKSRCDQGMKRCREIEEEVKSKEPRNVKAKPESDDQEEENQEENEYQEDDDVEDDNLDEEE